MSDFDDRLRAMLRERAEDAQTGPDLAERIIVTAHDPGSVTDLGRARRLRSHTLFPFLAAAAVVVLVVGVLLAVRLGSHRDDDEPAAPAPRTPTSSGLSSPSSSSVPNTSPATSASTPPPVDVHIADFRASDLSWVGTDDGYALGTGDCLSGAGRCTALVHTSDGTTWVGVHGTTPFNIDTGTGCTTRCVSGIRFADDRVGYVFGRNTLLMTTDGGASWQLQSGGASALEVADGVVLRIESDNTQRLLRSAVGSTVWQSVTLPTQGGVTPQPVQLVRSGRHVLVSSGLPNYLSYSGDDGATWQARGAICTGSAASSLAVGPDGSAAWLCDPLQSGVAPEVMLYRSPDGGRTSGSVPLATGGRYVSELAIPSAAATLVALDYGAKVPGLYRVTSAGVAQVAGGTGTAVNGQASFLGCESTTVCRWVPSDGSGLYTSRDGGASWQRTRF